MNLSHITHRSVEKAPVTYPRAPKGPCVSPCALPCTVQTHRFLIFRVRGGRDLPWRLSLLPPSGSIFGGWEGSLGCISRGWVIRGLPCYNPSSCMGSPAPVCPVADGTLPASVCPVADRSFVHKACVGPSPQASAPQLEEPQRCRPCCPPRWSFLKLLTTLCFCSCRTF